MVIKPQSNASPARADRKPDNGVCRSAGADSLYHSGSAGFRRRVGGTRAAVEFLLGPPAGDRSWVALEASRPAKAERLRDT